MTYTGNIENLRENQILVFGSNTEGRHGAGVALLARQRFGAKYGQSEGLQGRSYAIITKDLQSSIQPSRSPDQIKEQISKLYEFASINTDKQFFVAYKRGGKNLNYYSDKQMAEMFASFEIPSNVIFEQGFFQLMQDI